MMQRKVLKQGVHYFKPPGQGTRPIFKWSAIVDLIEVRGSAPEPEPSDRKGELDVEEATRRLQRLLD
jgi:hypothetical protein